jgi:hypothetical protein
METSIDSIYEDLDKIDRVDPVTGAIYRQRAQEVLATPSIALKIRKAIAERLAQVNQLLSLKTVSGEDSY